MTVVAASTNGHTFDVSGWLMAVLFIGVPFVITTVTLLLRRQALKLRPQRSDEEKTIPAGCLLAFASLFVLAGLLPFFFITVRPTVRSIQASRWPTTQGTVLGSKLATSRDSDGDKTYRIDIRYRYAVAGQDYESNQYDPAGTTYSGYRESKRHVVTDHPSGKAVTVHYDPSDPADAMLSTAIPPGTFTFVWFPILFCTVPLGLCYAFWRLQNNANMPGTAKPVKLAPAVTDARRKRRTSFIVILIFALFWNGFITFFWLATHTWCILPFALIGLLLALFAGQQWLALFNPLVSVSFARMPLHPGDVCDVTFAVQGNVLSIRSLSFKLEGREQVTFRQGTSSRTETKAVYVFPLLETTKNFEMEKGKLTIRLPADVMTSFTSRNNGFSWHLVCHGEITRRPDIKDEFDVTVLAKEAR